MMSSSLFLSLVLVVFDVRSGDPFLASSRCQHDCAFLFERVDLLPVEPMLGQHLACMLTVDRRARAHFAWVLRKLDRQADRLYGPERGMLDLDNHLARQRLR